MMILSELGRMSEAVPLLRESYEILDMAPDEAGFAELQRKLSQLPASELRPKLSQAAPACAACGFNSKKELRRCARCHGVSYCSRACQKHHWKVHKAECKKAPAAPKAAVPAPAAAPLSVRVCRFQVCRQAHPQSVRVPRPGYQPVWAAPSCASCVEVRQQRVQPGAMRCGASVRAAVHTT